MANGLNTLNLIQVKGGVNIKQGDSKSVLEYELGYTDGSDVMTDLGLDGKVAKVTLYNRLANEKWTTDTVVKGNRVSFTIDEALKLGVYVLDIDVAGHIFPSDREMYVRVHEGYQSYMDGRSAAVAVATAKNIANEAIRLAVLENVEKIRGPKGNPGDSIKVADVTKSGTSNIVTFTDGKTMIVEDGKSVNVSSTRILDDGNTEITFTDGKTVIVNKGKDAKVDVASIAKLSQSDKDTIRNEIDAPSKKEIKKQISDLQAFVGYTDDDIMGVEVDFKNRKFTRLAGAVNRTPGEMFDDVQAFGGRKRCILTDDGVVLAYHGEPGYTETGALTQAIVIEVEPAKGEEPAVTETYEVGTKVQVMVEQPKFYYKVVPLQLDKVVDGKGFHMRKARYYVSDVKKAGFKLHTAFIKDRKEKNFIYLSAYEGSVYDKSANAYLLADEQIVDFVDSTGDMLSSIAYAKPTSGVEQTGATRIGFRRIAANRGVGWSQAYAATVAATQLLFTIEYASMNTQTSIGRGNVDKRAGESTISYTEITGATTNLGNESGSVQNTNGINIVTYRGEENWWGNMWKWVDGLNIFNQSDLYVADHDFADDIGTDPYEDAGITISKVGGYISAFGYNEKFDWLFFPSETSGDSALPVGDNFYQTTTLDAWRVALLGGIWYSDSYAGGFCWRVSNASSNRVRSIGGRLVYVPDAA